jgi:hypothetical protein
MKARVLDRAARFVRGAGPYLLLEVLLPGGTLLALLLWWFSGGSARGQLTSVRRLPVEPISIQRAVCTCAFV